MVCVIYCYILCSVLSILVTSHAIAGISSISLNIIPSSPSNAISSFPSYIDFNMDKSFEGDMNAGLGQEVVIYKDDDFLVYNKPTLAQTAPGFAIKDSLATRVQQRYKIDRIDQMIVHRLDYATSGIVLFARTMDALKNLHSQFRDHKNMYKRYVAVVDGRFDSLEGEIDLPLG